jgi:hypothetical protein
MLYQITSLDRSVTYQPGDVRYYLPTAGRREVGESGHVIIVEALRRDILGGVGDAAYGCVRVVTDAGVRDVTTLEIGVLVTPVS